MQALKIMNYLTDAVSVDITDEGLVIQIGDTVYTEAEPNVEVLNRAVALCDPFVFNRGHSNHVLGNIQYTQSNGIAQAMLAGEYLIQQMPIAEAGNIKQVTEQTMISMEEYRQWRCCKTLVTLCENVFEDNIMPAYYLSNYNLTFKLLTAKGPVMVIGCGFTIPTGPGPMRFEESMLTIGAEDKVVPGFVFMEHHVFSMVDSHLGTYIVKGSQ